MKKIMTIAMAVSTLALAACDPAPVEAPAAEVVEAPAEQTGGPCGDGTVLGENEKCK